MKSSLTDRRPSPAMVVACLALFVALGGTSFAAVKLSKNSVGAREIKKNAVGASEIKKNAVASSEVKTNSLTGSDINESKLGIVPTAANATSATTAGNAANADLISGQRIAKINYAANDPAGYSTIFERPGLRISAGCFPGKEVDLLATSTENGSTIYTWIMGDNDPNPANPEQADLEDADFNVGNQFSLIASGDGNANFVSFAWKSQSGGVVTGSLYTNENSPSPNCEAFGHIVSG